VDHTVLWAGLLKPSDLHPVLSTNKLSLKPIEKTHVFLWKNQHIVFVVYILLTESCQGN